MKVVSLFSGAGGLDLGFKMAGHEIIWANDNYADAAKTYERNIGPHMICRDITRVANSEIPPCDIVIGGFPCQGFSVANTKRNENDGRNALYLELVRVIKARRPKFFLAENVKGLLSLGKGAIFQMILDDFRQMGYLVTHQLLNAADYGVPQKRERIIIIGTRSDLDFKYAFPAPTHAKNGAGNLKPWLGVGKALAPLPDPDKPHTLANHDYSKYKLRFNGYLGHRRVDPRQPAPTVTARGDDKGGVVVLHHPNNTRRMSARELATVQSFPPDFVFEGNRSSAYRQIANAVPPLLARALAKQFPITLKP